MSTSAIRAVTTVDRSLGEVVHHLAAVDRWQRTAAAVGYRLSVTPAATTWADGRHVRLDRIGRRSRPVARHRAEVHLDATGLPRFTVVRGPGRGGRLRLDVQETAAGVLLTAQFDHPAGSGPVTRLIRSRRRSRIEWALKVLTGMAVLSAHQTRVVVAGAVIRDGAVLAARRSYPAAVAGRWEFAGGKVAPGETDAAALRRELAEELGGPFADGLTIGERIGPEISLDVELVLRLYAVHGGGEPVPEGSHDEVRWISAADLDGLDWLDADRRLLPSLRPLLG